MENLFLNNEESLMCEETNKLTLNENIIKFHLFVKFCLVINFFLLATFKKFFFFNFIFLEKKSY